MRNVIRPILIAGAALLPALAMGTPATGFIAVPDCTGLVVNVDSDDAEMYVIKYASAASARTNDLLWDISRKGETVSDSQASLNSAGFWSTGDVWGAPQIASDLAYNFVTFANGDLYVDANDGASVDWLAAAAWRFGNSLPAGRDAGSGLAIPGTSAQFSVVTRTGNPGRMFPVRAQPPGSATAGSINVAFAPFHEVNPMEIAPQCTISASMANPALSSGLGGIIGYNVYRIPGSAGTVPTRQMFMDAIVTASDADGGWVYFIDLRTFNVALADTNPGSAGTDAPSDLTPTDLAGLQNPDGRMYSGDEVVIFQDSANRAGTLRPRAADLAPTLGASYWYAIQPVILGTMASYASADFTVNQRFPGDHRMDLDGDGEFDAVSLDTIVGAHNTPEFISPQAEASNGSQAGMGLTNGGLPFLSAPMFIDGASALPATGQVSLSGSVTGNDVNVQFTTGLEQGTVLGYNVYRVAGDQRVRVNEQPILAQGNESNVYALVDVASQSRGGARSIDYMVEIVYADGTAPTMVGPFAVSLDQQPVRRRR